MESGYEHGRSVALAAYAVQGATLIAIGLMTGNVNLRTVITMGAFWLITAGALYFIKGENPYCNTLLFSSVVLAICAAYVFNSAMSPLEMCFVQCACGILFMNPSLTYRGFVCHVIVLTFFAFAPDSLRGQVPRMPLGVYLAGLCTLLVMTVVCADLVRLLSVERKAAEKHEKANRALMEELEKRFVEAESATREKSDFLANMSHEIRTPINAVLGLDEVALRECTQEEIVPYLRGIQKAGQGLLSIINDILDFSKIEAGHIELVDTDYETLQLLEDAVNLMEQRAVQKGLKLTMEPSSGLPVRLRGDTSRIRQIMNNLLSNAVKYTKEGSILLSASAEVKEDGSAILEIRVKDTGIGIRRENMSRLFTSFTRLDVEKNRTVEGTGLGLAITAQIIKAMGGTITVESEYGVGSEFIARIPQRVVDATPVGALPPNARQVLRDTTAYQNLFTAPAAKVLIVDDNDLNLAVAKSLMKQTKVQVTTCTGGRQCLAAMQQEHFDLIFLDHMMPEMDGIETLKRARVLENSMCVGTPIVALTANAISGMRERYLAMGFDGYLSKPIDSKELEHIMLHLLPESCIATRWNSELGIMQMPDGNIVPAETAGENETQQISSRMVNVQLGLKYCAGQMEIYRDIAALYVEEGPGNLLELRRLYEAKDWQGYAVVVHALKSTSMTVGAMPLAELAQDQETAAKTGASVEELADRHFSMLEDYRTALQEIQRILQEDIVCTTS